MEDYIVIGRFGRPHGIKGYIRVVSFTDPGDNVLLYTPWYIKRHQQWEKVTLLQQEVSHQKIVVKIKGYEEREEVASLTNLDISVLRSKLPPLEPGEFYWNQLLGMQVKNTKGIILGNIKEIMPTGSHDVLIVTNGEKRYLIPYLPETFIINIDVSSKEMTVDWDETF